MHLRILACIVLTLSSTFSFQAQTTRVFTVAHQDDWQLFMNPNVFNSLQNDKDKTVIIHTTAGDAGAGMGRDAYYKAREEGAKRALRFLSNAYRSGAGLGDEMTREMVKIGAHELLRYRYRNAELYFMRLPDGNGDGSGYPIHEQKSLAKFYAREVVDFKAIDNSTTYTNKEDLLGTLRELIKSVHTTDSLQIHLSELDPTLNVDDHSDHQTTAKFVKEAVVGHFKGEFYYYINYQTGNLEPNLESNELLISAGCWGATTSGLGDYRHSSTWDDTHNQWLLRQYFRVVPIGVR